MDYKEAILEAISFDDTKEGHVDYALELYNEAHPLSSYYVPMFFGAIAVILCFYAAWLTRSDVWNTIGMTALIAWAMTPILIAASISRRHDKIEQTMNKMYPSNVSEMLHSDEWMYYESDIWGNQMYISDPDRAERMDEAAEHGGNGSTHGEVIQDWLDFIEVSDYPYWLKQILDADALETERWFDHRGRLHEVIG